jgi:hypothetical protein
VIISQTIYDLFPPTEFPPNSTLPLTPTELIQHVLVPEAAMRLVMADMNQSRIEAIKTLRDSAQYGVAMFPDDHTGDGYSASEEIIKARAAARRKELQKEKDREEEEDAELWGAFSEGEFEDLAVSETPSRANSQPRRECTAKVKPIIDSDNDSDVSIASSTASRSRKPRAKPASKTSGAAKKSKDVTTRAVPERTPSVEIIGTVEATRAPRPRPRPKVKESGTTCFSSIDVHVLVSDVEPNTGGEGEKLSMGTGTSRAVDLQKTPRAKTRVAPKAFGSTASSSTSSLASHKTRTRSSPR